MLCYFYYALVLHDSDMRTSGPTFTPDEAKAEIERSRGVTPVGE